MSAVEWQHEPCPLTPAELSALELLMQGLSYEQIADALGRKSSTIRSQLGSAYRRLGVRTSYQAVLQCVRAGWLTWAEDDPELAMLARIEALLQELLAAVEARTELTTVQRDYLERLDDYLRARGAPERGLSRRQMEQTLEAMLRDARGVMLVGGAQLDLTA
jgi:DNA-binding CsgD family transcriptional regulator